MKQTTGIILIIAALLLGYIGVQKLDESETNVKFLGINISAEDESKKEVGYIFLGLAALCLVGGVMTMRNR